MTPEERRKLVADEFMKARVGLRRYAIKLCAGDASRVADLLQDTALRCLEHADDYEIGTNFGGWAARMMHNHFIDERRKEIRYPVVAIADWDQAVTGAQQDVVYLRQLGKMLNRMPRNEMQVIVLRFVGNSYEEIADRLNIPVGTAKSSLHRAQRRFRRMHDDGTED